MSRAAAASSYAGRLSSGELLVAGVDEQFGVGAAGHERVGGGPILGEPLVVGHAVDVGGVAVGPAAEVARVGEGLQRQQATGARAVLRELLGGSASTAIATRRARVKCVKSSPHTWHVRYSTQSRRAHACPATRA